MTKANRNPGCDNSPKNKMVEDIAVALETGDTHFMSALLDSGTVWHDAGSGEILGEDILSKLRGQCQHDVLTIDQAISHDKVGAVNGQARRGKTGQRFCHVIEFTSAKCHKIRRVESYRG